MSIFFQWSLPDVKNRGEYWSHSHHNSFLVPYFHKFITQLLLLGRADNIAVVEDNKIQVRPPSPPPVLYVGTISIQKIPVNKYKDDYLNENDKTGWTCHPCQNLTSVLNDPRTTRRQTDFFTKQWGETFIPQSVAPLPLLGTVPKSYFNEFMKKYEFVSHINFIYFF